MCKLLCISIWPSAVCKVSKHTVWQSWFVQKYLKAAFVAGRQNLSLNVRGNITQRKNNNIHSQHRFLLCQQRDQVVQRGVKDLKRQRKLLFWVSGADYGAAIGHPLVVEEITHHMNNDVYQTLKSRWFIKISTQRVISGILHKHLPDMLKWYD